MTRFGSLPPFVLSVLLTSVAVVGGACGSEVPAEPAADASATVDASTVSPARDAAAPSDARTPPAPDAEPLPDLANPGVEISAGNFHTCVRFKDNKVKCWGAGLDGVLGNGRPVVVGGSSGTMGTNLPAVDFGRGRHAVNVASRQRFVCAVLDNARVKCWGGEEGGLGQLGLGRATDVLGDSPNEMGDALPFLELGAGTKAKSLAVGSQHSCVLFEDGRVKCWGQNNGALGLEDRRHRGSLPTDMGDDLPFVSLGTGKTAKALAAGFAGTCAILNDDTLKCWGSVPRLDGSFGGQPGTMGDALPVIAVGAGRTVKEVSLHTHVCVVLDNGALKCAGQNGQGQLGYGDDTIRYFSDALPDVNLGAGRKAVHVYTGLLSRTCAILDDGSVKCWGDNQRGALGVGDEAERRVPTTVDLGTGMKAKGLALGAHHGCALLENGRVKCWGDSEYGALGYGDTVRRGAKAGEMGDALPFVDLGEN